MTKDRVQKILDRMENNQYTGIPISTITDKIEWLWKWRKITEDEKNSMVDQVLRILGENK